jgi:hypothetical protein
MAAFGVHHQHLPVEVQEGFESGIERLRHVLIVILI